MNTQMRLPKDILSFLKRNGWRVIEDPTIPDMRVDGIEGIIYIPANLSKSRKLALFAHELTHVKNPSSTGTLYDYEHSIWRKGKAVAGRLGVLREYNEEYALAIKETNDFEHLKQEDARRAKKRTSES